MGGVYTRRNARRKESGTLPQLNDIGGPLERVVRYHISMRLSFCTNLKSVNLQYLTSPSID